MGYIEKTYGRSEKFLAFKVCFYDTLVPTREYKSGYAADRFARKCAAQGFGALSTGLQFQMVVASGSRFLPARQEGITDMDKEIRYFVNGYEMLLYLSGDREERKSVDYFELQDFESEEEAVAAARDFISEHKNAVNDQKHGIGSVTYWVAVVERAVEDAVMGWLPCDRDGVTEDEEGMVPDDATVAYISTLDGSREERAFNLAKHDYYGFLDYKEDRYTTVYGYMD